MMMFYLCGVARGWGQELAAHAVHRVTQTLYSLLKFEQDFSESQKKPKSSDYSLLVLLFFLLLLTPRTALNLPMSVRLRNEDKCELAEAGQR